jgi:transcriptional regulator with XRE-family HTH domain
MSNKDNKRIACNVRYLLYQSQIPKDDWTKWLSVQLDLAETDASEIILDGIADQSLLGRLATRFGVELSDLVLVELYPVQGPELAAENVRYLLGSLVRGEHGKMADEIGVDLTTLSKWKKGVRPRLEHLKSIHKYFGISKSVSLDRDIVFLELEPLTPSSRRKYLTQLVEKMSADALEKHFFSLKVLLDDD